MDKRTIIGFVAIFAIFVGWTLWMRPSDEEMAERQRVYDSTQRARQEAQRQEDSIIAALAVADSVAGTDSAAQGGRKVGAAEAWGGFYAATQGTPQTISLRNSRMEVELNTLGAQVNRVVLADYQTYDSNELVLISPADNNMNLQFKYIEGTPLTISTGLLVFDAVTANDSVAVLRAYADSLQAGYVEFRYTLPEDSYEMRFDVDFVGIENRVKADKMTLNWHNRMLRQEKVSDANRGQANRNADRELFYSGVYYKTPTDRNPDNVSIDQKGNTKTEKVRTSLDWVAFKQQYFAAIITAEGGVPFKDADATTKWNKRDTARNYLDDLSAEIGLNYDEDHPQMHFGFYYGPTKLRDLRSMHRGFDRMLPLGWTVISKSISRWLIVPVFNFLERFDWNYGIIIIVFTLLIRLVLLPVVFKSYQGGAIMRVLRPEMEALNKKYPKQEQAMQKQQEMMALQRKAGYSPMAGCLPVLIQMPFLTAMFMFFPIAIELRQKPFLWCNDLSNYDSILDFGFNIPFYGDHISLFCLLMFGMQFFYTWYTMRQQPSTQSVPGMKFMMYFMPFMMLFIFNSQSAGLNLYYLISLTFTMTVMMLIRRFTSEKKVRARMAAYDKKHATGKGKAAKKSSFQRRLEEMQKMAEQMQREQKKR